MQLEDFEGGFAPDDYTPRPRASQDIAARKRLREETQVVQKSAPAVRLTPMQAKIGIGVCAILFLAALTYSMNRTPAKPLQVPAAAPAAFSAPPTATPAPTPTPRTIGAYAAPDGLLLGQIAEDRAITPVAHYGSGWVAYQDGAGLVWVRVSDRPDLALVGKDLAQAPAPPVSLQPPPQTGGGLTTEQEEPTAAPDFYTTPPHVEPAFQQSLIGPDPNALACGGNPMCGGLTNAEAQAILDKQKGATP